MKIGRKRCSDRGKYKVIKFHRSQMRRNAASSPRYRFNYLKRSLDHWRSIPRCEKQWKSSSRNTKYLIINIFIFFFQRLIHQLRRNRDSFRTWSTTPRLISNHRTNRREIHEFANDIPPPPISYSFKKSIAKNQGVEIFDKFSSTLWGKFGEDPREPKWHGSRRGKKGINTRERAIDAMESCQSSAARPQRRRISRPTI